VPLVCNYSINLMIFSCFALSGEQIEKLPLVVEAIKIDRAQNQQHDSWKAPKMSYQKDALSPQLIEGNTNICSVHASS